MSRTVKFIMLTLFQINIFVKKESRSVFQGPPLCPSLFHLNPVLVVIFHLVCEYFHSNSILSVESDLLYELHVSLVNVKQVLDFIMVFPK